MLCSSCIVHKVGVMPAAYCCRVAIPRVVRAAIAYFEQLQTGIRKRHRNALIFSVHADPPIVENCSVRNLRERVQPFQCAEKSS